MSHALRSTPSTAAQRGPHCYDRGPVLVDFESRSRAILKRKGGRLYWEDSSSEAVCAVLCDVASEDWYTWRPDMPGPAPEIGVAVAHNASTFDRHAAAASGWRVREWRDSSSCARRAGLPGALDALAQRWLGRSKDKQGSKFTVGLSRPSRARARLGQLPELTPDVMARVQAYCVDDVEILAETWDRLEPWLDVDAPACEVDRVINDRGVCLDADLVRALQRQIERQQEHACAKAGKALGTGAALARIQASSPKQFTHVTGLPNAQKATLEDRKAYGDLIDHPLCAARLALASVVPGKLTAALERVSQDGRIRDMLGYYAAHTGRWAGYGLQPHNLPRIAFEDEAKRIGWRAEDYVDALADGAASAELTKRQVSGLLRSVLIAAPGQRLCVLDYAGIEARANAWAAGDTAALDVFRALDTGAGPDPYKVAAARVFGIDVGSVTKEQRGLGKVIELMLGYGAGADKFAESCAAGGTDLAALDVDAEAVVRSYRNDIHPAISTMWKACERAFRMAVDGRGGERGCCAGRWRYVSKPAADGRGGVDVWCVLPSGRPIVYSSARAKLTNRETKDGRKFKAWALSYQGRSPWREHVYGGLLVENAIQALCRDLLADALVQCESAGLEPVLHVHDEIVCECDASAGGEALEEMRRIMGEGAPAWARGLPIRLDGFHARRYRK